MTSDTSRAISSSRPKIVAWSAVNGRGPTNGELSERSRYIRRTPAAAELAREVRRRAAVDAELQCSEVAVEVVAGRLGGRDLHRDAQTAEARLHRGDEAAMDDPEIPVGQPVAQEQQRRPGERTLDVMGKQLRVARDGDEEVQVVVLGQDERLGEPQMTVEVDTSGFATVGL
jgi:hypothetical protein